MVETETATVTVAHAIQSSVAPVFLLSGIGAMLAVMTNRLARIVDRARGFEARLGSATQHETARLHSDLATLSRRATLINRAITLCTITALLVCAVVITLFVGVFLRFETSPLVALFFVGGMSSFFAGLLFFLREIFLATRNLRIGPQ
jgi:uncharacterized protein DUF2721